jgi:membrane protein required for colicin V production
MNTLDLILGVLFILNLFNGFRQGLIKALANLIGWFLALILAMRYTPELQPWMQQFSPDPTLQKIAAFVAIVMLVLLLTWSVGAMLQQILKHLKLSWLNRLTGSIFGLAKSLVMVLVVVYSASPWFSQTQLWQTSKLIQLLLPYSADSFAFSKQVVQKTTEAIEQSQRKDHNQPQDAIIPESSANDSSHQVENPFL